MTSLVNVTEFINNAKIALLESIRLDLKGCRTIKDVESNIKVRLNCLDKIKKEINNKDIK